MSEHEIVVLRAVLPELLLELSGRLRLDVTYGCAKAVPHTKEALISSPVP